MSKRSNICAQAISRQGKRLILPMGRGRKSFSFHLPDLPEQIGAVSLVWNGGYELHIVVSVSTPASPVDTSSKPVQATADLGEIHLAAVTTTTGKGLVVTGRGIRTVKQHYNKTLSQLSRLQSHCQKGSKRWRRLQYTRERERGKSKQGCRRSMWAIRRECVM